MDLLQYVLKLQNMFDFAQIRIMIYTLNWRNITLHIKLAEHTFPSKFCLAAIKSVMRSLLSFYISGAGSAPVIDKVYSTVDTIYLYLHKPDCLNTRGYIYAYKIEWCEKDPQEDVCSGGIWCSRLMLYLIFQ